MRYHLQYLEKKGKVFSERTGKNRVYYGFSGSSLTEAKEGRMSQDEKRVLNMIKNDPGIGLFELGERINLPRARIGSLVRRLRTKRLVIEIETPSGTGFEFVTRERLAQELLMDLVEKFLDGDVDRDTFLKAKALIEKGSM